MRPDQIVLNEKARAFLKDDSKFIINSGPTGTGKTFITGLKTFFRIVSSPKGYDTYAIVAESQVTAEKMFVDDPTSFVNIFPICKYVSGKKPHIQITTKNGTKRVYLGGYGTRRDWTKILGLNIDGLHVEEGTIADDDFLREAFVRATRKSNSWLHVTTNGGVPEQILYTEFFDKSYYDEEFNRNMPIEEKQYLQQSDKRFKFWYWGFDDSATLTAEDIKGLFQLFPKGSFFFNSKILGIRGYSTGLLYASLFTNKFVTKEDSDGTYIEFKDISIPSIQEVIIGCDIGKKAKTVFTLTGYTYKYQRAIVVDVLEIVITDHTDYTHIIEDFNKWLIKWYQVFYTAITQVRVDKSNPLFVRQLRNNIAIKSIHVLESISDKIVYRVSYKQQLIMQRRLIWSNYEGAKKSVAMLKMVKDDGKGGHIDDNTPEIDYSDSLDYSLEPRINNMSVYTFRR